MILVGKREMAKIMVQPEKYIFVVSIILVDTKLFVNNMIMTIQLRLSRTISTGEKFLPKKTGKERKSKGTKKVVYLLE